MTSTPPVHANQFDPETPALGRNHRNASGNKKPASGGFCPVRAPGWAWWAVRDSNPEPKD